MNNIKKMIFYLMIVSLGFNSYSEEILSKKYYNCIFSGGKEKIYSETGNINNVRIYYSYIDINFNKDYSTVKIKYYLKNYGRDISIIWAYPFLVANLEKTMEIKEKIKNENQKIILDYKDYKVFINGEPAPYTTFHNNTRENLLPYKIGDTSIEIDKETIKEQNINMYYYTYSWHTTPVELKEDEKKVIEVHYTASHYFNEITLKQNNDITGVEDPALEYISKKINSKEFLASEKVFAFLFNTSYSKKEKIIDKVVVKLTANIINQDFLKILPINYKRKNNRYYWVYKDFDAEPLHNIFVKISPVYSEYTVNPLLFDYYPEKKADRLYSYFELNNKNNEIIISYLKNKKEEKLKVKKLKILTEIFTEKSELKKSNRPKEISIEFADNPDFYNSIKTTKEISYRTYSKSLNKRSSLTLYDDEEIECKYIKIKFIEFSEPDEILKVSDIEILK
ncbi:MAG: hypothetical protein JXB50_01295 [Spirochaetes bacterium]|nr:hypothetical protein [Spirochaetota bacterium]